jgi:hypothetical protein
MREAVVAAVVATPAYTTETIGTVTEATASRPVPSGPIRSRQGCRDSMPGSR